MLSTYWYWLRCKQWVRFWDIWYMYTEKHTLVLNLNSHQEGHKKLTPGKVIEHINLKYCHWSEVPAYKFQLSRMISEICYSDGVSSWLLPNKTCTLMQSPNLTRLHYCSCKQEALNSQAPGLARLFRGLHLFLFKTHDFVLLQLCLKAIGEDKAGIVFDGHCLLLCRLEIHCSLLVFRLWNTCKALDYKHVT